MLNQDNFTALPAEAGVGGTGRRVALGADGLLRTATGGVKGLGLARSLSHSDGESLSFFPFRSGDIQQGGIRWENAASMAPGTMLYPGNNGLFDSEGVGNPIAVLLDNFSQFRVEGVSTNVNPRTGVLQYNVVDFHQIGFYTARVQIL